MCSILDAYKGATRPWDLWVHYPCTAPVQRHGCEAVGKALEAPGQKALPISLTQVSSGVRSHGPADSVPPFPAEYTRSLSL